MIKPVPEYIRMIDIHSHLNLDEFDFDKHDVASVMKEKGVGAFTVGTYLETSQEAVSLAKKHEHLWAIVGHHPIRHKSHSFECEKLEGLIQQNPQHVVGIGECGFDYFHCDKKIEKDHQEIILRKQIELALKYDLPLMLHVRPSVGEENFDAYEDTIAVLQNYKGEENLRGVVHFFAGNTNLIDKFKNLDFSVSFTGVITFASGFTDLIKHVSLEEIMIETDSPYVAPRVYRGKRCEPWMVEEVGKRVADIYNIPEKEAFQKYLTKTKSLFRLS